MKKYWVITEFYYPNGNTTSYIMTKIAEGLGNYADVNVITSTKSTNNQNLAERINNVSVYRVKDSDFDKNIFPRRIIKLTLLGLRLFFKSANLVKKNDTVLVVTNPATIIIFMRILKIFKKFNLIILIHDVFPENLVVAKVLRSSNLLFKITLGLFNQAYTKADKLIVIGRDMCSFIENKLGAKCPPIVYIPNFADVNEIQPRPKKSNRILNESGLTDKFVILFTGNIGRAQDLPSIIRTMELLKEEKNIHLLIIGNGALENDIKQFIRQKSLSNITILSTMRREFSNDFLNAGDIGLVTLQKGRKGIGIPSKTYTFLAAAKPIIAIVDKGSEIYQMVHESGCGWWIEPGDPFALKDLISDISKLEEEVKTKSIIARKLAVEKYSVDIIIAQFQANIIC